jgi:hypothetical protein
MTRKRTMPIVCLLALLGTLVGGAGASTLPRYIHEDDFRLRGPYCGVAAVHAAARYRGLGTPQDYVRHRVERARPDIGSSLTDLVLVAEALDLPAAPAMGLTVKDLRHLAEPAVLHVKSDLESPDFDHWILLTGIAEDGSFLVSDVPSDPIKLTADELAVVWSGAALVTGDDVDHLARGWLWYSAVLLGSIGLLAARFVGSAPERPASRGPWVMAVQATGILVVAGGSALALHAGGGYLARPDARQQVEAARAYAFLPRFDLSEIAPEPEGRHFVLIDARGSNDFIAGTVPGALNLPPYVSDEELDSFVAAAEESGRQLRIFCQTSGCPLSDRLASRLWQRGFREIELSRDGFTEWSERWPGKSRTVLVCPVPVTSSS